MTEDSKTEKQYGIKYPSGSIAWSSIDPTIAPNFANRIERAKQIQGHDVQVKSVGITPNKNTRIKFVMREVKTVYGEPQEVGEDD